MHLIFMVKTVLKNYLGEFAKKTVVFLFLGRKKKLRNKNYFYIYLPNTIFMFLFRKTHVSKTTKFKR